MNFGISTSIVDNVLLLLFFVNSTMNRWNAPTHQPLIPKTAMCMPSMKTPPAPKPVTPPPPPTAVAEQVSAPSQGSAPKRKKTGVSALVLRRPTVAVGDSSQVGSNIPY
tara:strand:- start:61 stop:387 length:327 start_codon:yes stop_codon:yes gene_type:complete